MRSSSGTRRFDSITIAFSVAASVLVCAFAVAATEAKTRAQPQVGAWGFDLSGMDASVRPGDDFDRYANGAWRAKTEIPADRGVVGSFYALAETSSEGMAQIIHDLE